MANLFQRVIGRIASAIDAPRYISKEEMAHQIYSRPQTDIVRGGWAVRVSETLNIMGFIVRCTCDAQYVFPDAFEACCEHTCPSCKEKLPSLLKFVGIDPKETPIQQWPGIFLSVLPRRPFSVDAPKRSPIQQVGDWGTNDATLDEGTWDGEKDKARSKAFVNSDPGSMGPGF